MGKILFNKNTKVINNVSDLFDEGFEYGQIVLCNNQDDPGLYMTKDDGNDNPMVIKLNSASKVSIDESLSQKSGDIVSGDTVHDALSKIKNNYYTKQEVENLIASGGSFVPELYYTKVDVNNISGNIETTIEAVDAKFGDYIEKASILKTEQEVASVTQSGKVVDALVIKAINNKFSNYVAKGDVVESAQTATSANTANSANMANSANTANSANMANSANTATSAQTAAQAATAAGADKLNHNVTLSLSGEVNGSVTADFSQNNYSMLTYKTFTTVSSLSNLTFENFLTVANISASSTLSIATTGLVPVPAGAVREGHLIIRNSSASNIVVTISNDDRVVATNGYTMSIEANGVGELNVLVTNDGTNYTIYLITS